MIRVSSCHCCFARFADLRVRPLFLVSNQGLNLTESCAMYERSKTRIRWMTTQSQNRKLEDVATSPRPTAALSLLSFRTSVHVCETHRTSVPAATCSRVALAVSEILKHKHATSRLVDHSSKSPENHGCLKR